MEYRTLGSSGCVVSTFALGTMTFGTETDQAGAHAQLDRFIEAGGTLIDTADVYSDGAAEEIIGRWLAARPPDVVERVVLATKGRFSTGADPNGAGSSRRHLERALDASLRRLGVDAVDLYQVHAWDPITPIEETLSFLDGAVRAGKVALCRPVELHRLADPKDRRRRRPPRPGQADHPSTAVQPAGTRDRVGDRAGLPVRGSGPAALVAARRWLVDRQVPRRPTAEGRHPARREPRPRCRGLRPPRAATSVPGTVIETVQALAEERGVSMAQVALAWLADRPAVELGHPRRPHPRPTRRQSGRCRAAPERRRDGPAGRSK